MIPLTHDPHKSHGCATTLMVEEWVNVAHTANAKEAATPSATPKDIKMIGHFAENLSMDSFVATPSLSTYTPL